MQKGFVRSTLISSCSGSPWESASPPRHRRAAQHLAQVRGPVARRAAGAAVAAAAGAAAFHRC